MARRHCLQVGALAAPVALAALCVGDDPGLKAFVKIKKPLRIGSYCISNYLLDDRDEQGALQTIRYLAPTKVCRVFVELPLPDSWDATVSRRSFRRERCGRADDRSGGTRAFRARCSIFFRITALTCMANARRFWAQDCWSELQSRVGFASRELPSMLSTSTHPTLRTPARADIVVAGVGNGPGDGPWIKQGAVVIDFGYGKKGGSSAAGFVGDVDFDSVKIQAGLLTPCRRDGTTGGRCGTGKSVNPRHKMNTELFMWLTARRPLAAAGTVAAFCAHGWAFVWSRNGHRAVHNRRRIRPMVVALTAALAGGAFVTALHALWHVPRPYLVVANAVQLVPATGWAFPSGHAAVFFALAISLWLWNRLWGAVGLAVAAAVGVARVSAGVHWPTDILGGAILGTAVAVLVNFIVQKHPSEGASPLPLGRRKRPP